MADVLEAVARLTDDRVKAKFESAISVVERAIALYGLPSLAFSFNGGKDSTVLLHIIRAAVAMHEQASPSGAAQAKVGGLSDMVTFFFDNPADFREVVAFTYATGAEYNLQLKSLHGGFRQGLEALLESTSVKAILLGTRKGDPNAVDQETFCPSSAGWPPFMRVNPVLHWTYHDVWTFLREAGLPYCSLYDQGYTSLGAVSNTHRNSALLKEDGSYAPAYMLPDTRLERAGRSDPARHASVLSDACETAGVIIVGDEILAAKVEDVNTRFLCKELRVAGWRVCKVAVVRDDVKAIAAEIKTMSAAFNVVLTAGGVGPTVDDMTLEALAEACDTHISRNPELERRIRAYFGSDVTNAHLKMAEIPEGKGSETSLIEFRTGSGALSPFPLVRCRNVYALPGIPSLLQEKWPEVKADLRASHEASSPLAPFHSVVMRLRTDDETAIADPLKAVAQRHGPNVSCGSYPVTGQADGVGLVLSVESKDAAALEAAAKDLEAALEPGMLSAKLSDNDFLGANGA
ncbi:FAD synthase [Auxenochlorella protothecoides]|uniref:FAD synthase n=1 Tax=Auxenochlorella protothecoides TaxID=3075 RepID=A0A087SPN5_AUXPR|nr:FAD synthase [Auxenochlorella protothecoides]KFM27689.1 FAD synthase [Auxenochlorella protothecoides]RMZ54323.1 hypothetical protein APUTEX25_001481 [Auxenochlorella protothecoides]|eukprot:RMZ54323.1 hypothetical protein APUTEX25_001481 [Auxenochlorella protothecoides]